MSLCHFLISFPLNLLVPQKRGAVLGSISSAQTTNPIPLELRDTLNLEYLDKRPISPYEKRNQILLDYAAGLKPLEVPAKLSLEEAAGIFEVWKGIKAIGRSQPFSSVSALLLILIIRYSFFGRGIPL